MNEDRHEVFRGHLEECLRHLGTSLASSVPKGSRGAAQAKKPLADFCGVTGAEPGPRAVPRRSHRERRAAP